MLLFIISINGSMPEWLMGADCKSASIAYVGSNPTRPSFYILSSISNLFFIIFVLTRNIVKQFFLDVVYCIEE